MSLPYPVLTVGGGLLPIAAGQFMLLWLIPPYQGQAPCHRLSVLSQEEAS